VKRVLFLAVVLCLIAGFIGCGSAPKYAENSEVPWEVFYSATQNNREFQRLPYVFYVQAFVSYDSSFLHVSRNGEAVTIYSQFDNGGRGEVRKELFGRLKPDEMNIIYIKKGESQWRPLVLDRIDGFSFNEIEAEIQAKRQADEAERQRIQAEEKRKKQEEDAKPRFSPEGKEYVKKPLLEVVGETKNQANRGKTLFFESSTVRLRNTGVAGQYLVDQLVKFESSGNVIMEFYGKIPASIGAALFSGYGYTILYRVEINQAGMATFKIDSFRE